jgi:hypothetical protein
VFPHSTGSPFSDSSYFMAKAISNIRKKGRGRPRVGATQVNVRIPPAEVKALDGWIKSQPTPRPSRPEAIRRLVEYAIVMAPTGPLPK